MNSMEYEVDAMGGLMPQILALTAPPGAQDISPQQQSYSASYSHLSSNGDGQAKPPEAGLAAHPYFRRPGRGHNHDCCDACGEGGDLICCDLCPASFHLTCHDPPLDEEEIPTGEWACHQCRMGGNEDDRNSCTSSKSSKGSKQIRKKDDAKLKEDDKKVFASGREFEISNTPLTTLIKTAAVINPTQFTLPYEMTLPANFPGEPKETMVRKNGSRRGLPKKKPYELDNGIVPLPAKLCFQCNKSCRTGPLIPCDFCPLFYHLDCLDPPLTTPPTGLWMCPNHPEHHMDTTLLQSHSLTERVKLWDKFSVPVDQHSVKLQFFQKCHRLHPPFRFKVKKSIRSRLKVPDAIKAHYEDPPDLLPHLSPSHYLPFPPPHDPYPSPTTFSQPTLPNITLTSSTTTTTTVCSTPAVKNETLPTLSGPILPASTLRDPALRDSALRDSALPRVTLPHGSEGAVPDQALPDEDLREEKDDSRTVEVERRMDLRPTQEEKDEWLASLLSLQSSIIRHMAIPRKDSIKTEDLSPMSPPRPNFLNGDLTPHDSRGHKICVDGMSNHIGDAVQQGKIVGRKPQKRSPMTGLKSSRAKRNTPHEILSETLTNLGESLRERIEENHDLPLSNLDQSVIEVLAYERLKEILEPPKPALVRSMPALCTRALLCPLIPDIRLKDYSPKHKKICSDPVPMTYRILNIGRGSNNHVDLEKYGHCNYISQNHACIMFDETTGHYELLNYSEYDTKVDGVTYHCNYTDKTVSQGTSPPFLQHVKAIIAARRGDRMAMVPSPSPAMNSRPGEDLIRCECKRSEAFSSNAIKENGWEGTAVLHHGSYIRFGCIKFVFSVVEEASKGDWAKDTEITYEKFLKEANEERAEKKEKEKQKESQKEEDEKEMEGETGEKEDKMEDKEEDKKEDKKDEKNNLQLSSSAS